MNFLRFFIACVLFHAATSHAQLALKSSLSLPNGVESGLELQASKLVKVGASYGFLYHADVANLNAQLGSGKVYLFGTVSILNVNHRGRDAITSALEDTVAAKMAQTQNAPFKRVFNGFAIENKKDYAITDYGAGAGLGVRHGIFFMEGGVRTTKLTSIGSSSLNTFMGDLANHVHKNKDITPAEKQVALMEVERMREDMQAQMKTAFKETPGGMKLLPEVRLGLRIPLRKFWNKKKSAPELLGVPVVVEVSDSDINSSAEGVSLSINNSDRDLQSEKTSLVSEVYKGFNWGHAAGQQ